MAPHKPCSFEWTGVRCSGVKKAAYPFEIGVAGSTFVETGKVDLCEAHSIGLKGLQASPCKIYIGRKFKACTIERADDFVRACHRQTPPERWFQGTSVNPTGVDLLRQAHTRTQLRAATGASEPTRHYPAPRCGWWAPHAGAKHGD